ncbi:MAG: glucose 1-dehydrogenase [Bifidobacteriaceae bacterium]|jgi:NAD(P)-dependent dehydrogenase (short-subunit alcohol dehydrogenase family)|nr:glucose 1-dehydrogenase [Bifidobacteriaceae bacterium]
MTKKFDGKVALVTGAASGIGRAVSRELAEQGARLVVVDLSREAVDETVALITSAGGEAKAVVADVADPAMVRSAVEYTESQFGRLDLAFNNAGITGPTGLLADIDIEGYQRTINVNLNAVFYGMYYEIPAMLRAGGGAIVNTSSILGLVGTPTAVPYVTAKHGVTGMTKAAAVGYAEQGIRINSVHPGYIDTPLLQNLGDARRSALISLHPQGRLGTDKEVAAAVLWLLSDDASFASGTQLVVDGGYTAR